MPFLSILLRYQLKRRKRRKRVVLKNRYDSNHQSLYKNIKLYNDIDWNPGPEYVNESTEYCYLHRLLKLLHALRAYVFSSITGSPDVLCEVLPIIREFDELRVEMVR